MISVNRACLLILVIALSAAPALSAESIAEFGSGEASRYADLYPGEGFRDILNDAREPPMAELGDNAVRFSSQPALGGTGYIIALRANGNAEVSWFRGHSSLGWRRTRRARFRVAPTEYQTVVAEVDRLLAIGIDEARTRSEADDEEIVMCSDGPGYLTERIRDNEATWFRPSCSGVNGHIATFLTSWAFRRLGS
jgi:hypothetical protein